MPRFHFLAFLEQPLFNDAAHLWAYFSDLVRGGAAREFAIKGDGLGFDGHKAHVRGLLLLLLGWTAVAAGCQLERQKSCHDGIKDTAAHSFLSLQTPQYRCTEGRSMGLKKE